LVRMEIVMGQVHAILEGSLLIAEVIIGVRAIPVQDFSLLEIYSVEGALLDRVMVRHRNG